VSGRCLARAEFAAVQIRLKNSPARPPWNDLHSTRGKDRGPEETSSSTGLAKGSILESIGATGHRENFSWPASGTGTLDSHGGWRSGRSILSIRKSVKVEFLAVLEIRALSLARTDRAILPCKRKRMKLFPKV
jgi:hypothetical protein